MTCIKHWILGLAWITCTQQATAQDTLLQHHLEAADFFKLRDELAARGNTLDNTTRLYYSSFTDNAFNKNELATQRADSFLRVRDGRWTQPYMLRLQEMLMDSYVKTFRYKAATEISEVIMQQYTDEGREGLLNAQKIWGTLTGVPPQSLALAKGFSIPVTRNAINLFEIPVQVGDHPEEQFIFDTGANISTISEAYAQKLGLKPIDTRIQVNGGQGRKVQSGLAVADRLRIGDAVFTNVVFLVMPDDKLEFPQINFAIHGIIGFPVLSAFKEIHIATNGNLTVPAQPNNNHIQNLALSQLTPLLQTRTDNNDTLIFQFDTGAANTNMFSNYFEKYKDYITSNGSRVKKKVMSAGGGRKMAMYELDSLRLHIGNSIASLQNVGVYTREVHTGTQGIAVGNMGHDVIDQFKEMTINFDRMYIDFK